LALTLGACCVGSKSGPRKMLYFYFVLAGLTTVTLGKIGSDMNYFIEFLAAAAILAGLFCQEALNRLKAPLIRWTALAMLLAAICQWTVMPGTFNRFQTVARGTEPHPFDPLTEMIRKIEGPILAENMGILIAAGKPVLFEPYGFAQLAYNGLWDEKKILDRLDRKEFPLILLETNLWRFRQTSRFTPGFVAHLRANYRPVKIIAGQILCLPLAPGKAPMEGA
jgi:hypothetical protein